MISKSAAVPVVLVGRLVVVTAVITVTTVTTVMVGPGCDGDRAPGSARRAEAPVEPASAEPARADRFPVLDVTRFNDLKHPDIRQLAALLPSLARPSAVPGKLLTELPKTISGTPVAPRQLGLLLIAGNAGSTSY